MRYYTTYERSFHKALATLTKLQTEKKKSGNWVRFAAGKKRNNLVKEAGRINEERNQPGWGGALPQFVTPEDLEEAA